MRASAVFSSRKFSGKASVRASQSGHRTGVETGLAARPGKGWFGPSSPLGGGLGSDLPEPNRLRQRVDAEAIIGLQCEADKAKMWPTITIANTHSLFVNDGFPPLIPIYWGFFRPMSGSKTGSRTRPLEIASQKHHPVVMRRVRFASPPLLNTDPGCTQFVPEPVRLPGGAPQKAERKEMDTSSAANEDSSSPSPRLLRQRSFLSTVRDLLPSVSTGMNSAKS